MRNSLLPFISIVCCAVGPALAAAPELHRVDPPGGTRGTEMDLTLRGKRLADAQEILFYDGGIEVLSITSPRPDMAVAKMRIAPTCRLGEHALRLRTATGVSELRTFHVGALPMVNEQEPNSDFAQPQVIELNQTVLGVVENEDVDHYALTASAGQRINAEIEAIRLGETMFDPYIAILDGQRFELDACDDSALALQDSVVSIVAPKDGTYIVQVREAAYGGSGACRYRLHVGSFPRPRVTFPIGGRPGATMTARHLGDAAGEITEMVALPDAPIERWPILASDDRGIAPSPTWMRVSNHTNVMEPTGDDSKLDPQVPPVAFNGILASENERDNYQVTLKKDQEYNIRLLARSYRSPLDGVINIFTADGKHLKGNDDSQHGLDSTLRFRAPTDGEYQVRVRDHLGRGGPLFVYRLEIDSPQPSLTLSIERYNSRAYQYRQAIPVAQGNRTAALLRVHRREVSGAVTIETALPKGVSCDAPELMADVQHVPVVFSAAADAEVGGGLFPLRGRIARKRGDIVGGFEQIVPMVIAPPNDTIYYQVHLDRVAMAVTKTAPFKITLTQPAVPLVQAGRQDLKVSVERVDGYDKAIEVRILWAPPGVSFPGSIKIPKGAKEAVYKVSAAGDAPPRTWPIVMIARGPHDGGERWVSSQRVNLTVTEPYVSGSIQMVAAEQGQTTSIICALQQKKPFDGEAAIKLLNLPPKTNAAVGGIEASDDQAVFEVAIEKDAPCGKHKNIFCEATVMQNGHPVVHRFAFGSRLRIDPPRVAVVKTKPPPEDKPQPPEKKEPPKQATKKPLSRLEQLRQAAKEREQANNADAEKSRPESK